MEPKSVVRGENPGYWDSPHWHEQERYNHMRRHEDMKRRYEMEMAMKMVQCTYPTLTISEAAISKNCVDYTKAHMAIIERKKKLLLATRVAK